MKKKYDYLIVGAGLYGATFAHIAQQNGYSCLIIDKRDVIGGNIYCKEVEGINVHQYGAHIFHTSNKEIWDMVNNIVPFNRYTNCPVANYKGKLYNLPFNMNTFNQIWGTITPDEVEKKLEQQRILAQKIIGHDGDPCNLEEQALMLIGPDIYEKLIKGYTQKQWGRPCSDLPSFIIKRLPLRMVFDNNYFNDTYQGIPIGGYNKLIEGLLKGTDIEVGVDFIQHRSKYQSLAGKVVYTGMIDEYFDFCYTPLQYRSVRFETEILPTSNYQGNAVVNYTDADTAYTRIIEHKHFEQFGNDVYSNKKTVISKEYSTEWHQGIDPYYPINDEVNNNKYLQYKALADKETNVLFGGRLAEYRYYDMDDVMEAAINQCKKEFKQNK